MTDGGAQVVKVGRRAAYRWTGQPELAVGEQVVLPPAEWGGSEWVGTVTALGTLYTGPLRAVIERYVPEADSA